MKVKLPPPRPIMRGNPRAFSMVAGRAAWVCNKCKGEFIYKVNETPNFCPYCRTPVNNHG